MNNSIYLVKVGAYRDAYPAHIANIQGYPICGMRLMSGWEKSQIKPRAGLCVKCRRALTDKNRSV